MANQRPTSSFESSVLLLALLQVALALWGVAVLESAPAASLLDRVGEALRWLAIAAFAAFGVLLRLGQRSDPATRLLGGYLLLAGAAFSMKPLGHLADARAASMLGGLSALLHWLPVEALSPWFLWRFVGHFPQAVDSQRTQFVMRLAQRATLLVGLGLIALNIALAAAEAGGEPSSSGRLVSLLAPLDHRLKFGLFAPLVYGLCLVAFFAIPLRMRTATVKEKHRVRRFALGLGAALLPSALFVLLGSLGVISQEWTDWLLVPALLLVLSVLLWVCWALFARQAVESRVLIQHLVWRRAVRELVGLLFFLPAPLLVWTLLRMDEPLRATWSGQPLVYSFWFLLAMFAPALRSATLAPLDRWLDLGGGVDEGELQRITESLGRSESTFALRRRLSRELVSAFGCERAKLFLDPSHDHHHSGAEMPSDVFATLFSLRRDPLLLDHRSGRAVLKALPHATQTWLSDERWLMLAPVLDTMANTRAVIAVGERNSQLAYSASDRNLLQGIASACGLVLERLNSLESRDRRQPASEFDSPEPAPPGPAQDGHHGNAASECVSCQRISDGGCDSCPHCGNWTTPAKVPVAVPGKLQLQRRIGNGGVGAVYLAQDLVLQRPVAVKALSDISSLGSAALRTEARSMAAVEHPHLATIYGAEIWNDTLLLTVEHLGGGSLSERLENAALPWPEVVRLGAQLGRALEQVHHAGFLHGDVKPSNIVYSLRGVPKLIDFGLTRLSRDPAFAQQSTRFPQPLNGPLDASEIPEDLQGTPLYAPPEAWRGQQADAFTDLWPLALVLWECVAGSHPFAKSGAAPLPALMERYRGLEPEELSSRCPREFSRFLCQALAADPAHRFADATTFCRAIESLARRFEISLTEPSRGAATSPG